MDDIVINPETKILVLSISSWNTKKGMNTWPVLLEGHDPERIAHICFKQDVPNNPVCNNYFVISENKVIKSIIKRRLKTGVAMKRCDDDAGLKEDLAVQNARYSKMKKHRNAFTLLGRELLWKIGKWKTKELDEFVKGFCPDVVLYVMEGYLYFNRVCRYVKKISGAKSIGFFCDDNFTYKQNKGLSNRVLRFFQRRSLKKSAKKTDNFFAITNKTKNEADAFFKTDCIVLTKPCYNIPVAESKEYNFPLKIFYAGNLGIGRDKSLHKFVKALFSVNAENKYFELSVYTSTELPQEIVKDITCDFCSIHPAIPQDEVLKLEKDADILLFLEALDGKDVKTARLSFSTKITDYLSVGKCIFAVGPKDIAPIEYLEENGCAVVASCESEIADRLKEIKEDKNVLNRCVSHVVACAAENHDKTKILNVFNSTIDQTINKK